MLTRRDVLLAGLPSLGLTAAGAARATDFDVSPWPADQPLPATRFDGLDGKVWRIEELRGRVVLLNFWATWCAPCRAEMPSLQQLAELYGPEKLLVIAINFQEGPRRIRQYAQAGGLTLPVALDRDGAIARAFGVKVFPTTIVIDARGRPRQRVRGEMDWSGRAAAALVEPLLPR